MSKSTKSSLTPLFFDLSRTNIIGPIESRPESLCHVRAQGWQHVGCKPGITLEP